MKNLPSSLIEAASKYPNLHPANKKRLFVDSFKKHHLSVKALAELCGTYPNKIRREAIKMKISIPNKSQAQKAALASGRHKHPTKGTKRSSETKVKISNGMAEVWKDLNDEQLRQRSEIGREQWNKKTDQEKYILQQKAGQKIREAAMNGSKLERFLMAALIEQGHRVEFHKEHFLSNERLQVDLFLPILNTAIEVDGPSHFQPIWGEATLARNQMSDATKNGLLLNMGFVIIRIRQQKHLSQKFKRELLFELLNVLDDIESSFPDKNNRYIELGN